MPITLERIPHDKQVAIRTMTVMGIPYRKIQSSLCVSHDVITAINRQIPSNSQEVEQYKKGLINESYGLSQRAFNRVSDEKLDAMNALQLTTISAIAIDKARDMEGSNRPVFNIVEMSVSINRVIAESTQRLQAIDAALASVQTQ